MAICAAFVLPIVSADAAVVTKRNNTQNLNKNGSWTTFVPGSADIALWDSTVTAANTTAIGANLSWLGIQITNPGGLVTINGTSGRTLTLGTSGINMSAATQNLTLNCALMLGGAQVWDVTTGRALASSGVIGGSGTLSKNGLGTLSLTGLNTYSGGTTINGGVVQINSASSLGGSGGTATINGGTLELLGSNTISTVRNFQLGNSASTLQVDTGSSLTISGTIANAGTAGSLIKTGAGTLILSASAGNTYGGAGQTTSINAGTLQLGSDSLLGNSANTITFNGGTLLFSAGFNSARGISLTGAGTINTNNNAATLSGVISGAGVLSKTGAGTLTLSGPNTYSGGTTISGGNTSIISVASSGNLGSGAVTISGGAQLLTTAGSTFSNSLILGGTGGSVQSDGLLVSGMLNVASGTRLVIAGTGISETTSGTGRLEKLGAGTLVLATTSSYSGGTYLHDGTLAIANSAGLGPQPTNNPTFNVLTVDNGARLVQSVSGASRRNVLIGTGGAVVGAVMADFVTPNPNVIAYRNGVFSNVAGQTGGGTMDSGVNGFGGANTFTGNVVVNSGATVAVSRDVNFGAAANQIFLNGGSLRVEDGVDITASGGTAATSVLATFSTNRQIILGAGTNTIEIKNYADTNTSFDASVTNPIVPAAGRPTSHLNTLTLNGAISGAGGLVKAGDGMLVLTNTGNSYSGTTTINGGTLSIADQAALGASSSSMIINPTGIFQATGSFTTSRAVTLGGTGGSASGGTFDVASGVSETRTGIISGSGSLTKIGSGTLTLNAINTYTGETYINGGTVSTSNNQAFGPQPTLGSSLYGVHLGNGTTFQSLVSSVGGNRQTELVSGTATLDIGAGYSNQRNGVIYGAGGLIKAGGGTQVLTNANTYTGGTTINAGTLQINNVSGSGTGTGTVTVNNGAVLSGLPTGNGFTTAGFISGNVTVNGGGALAARSGGTFTFGGLALNASAIATFELGASTSSALINVTGTNGFTLTGLSTINIANFGGGLATGTYRLFDYTGTALANLNNLQLGSTAGGAFSYSLVNNTANTSVDLLVATSANQWGSVISGNWSLTSNWVGGVPNGAGVAANFLGVIPSPQTVTVDGAFLAGTLTFDNVNSYTIAGDNVAGHGITLNNNGPANITVLTGSHTVAAPIALTNNVDIAAKSGTALTISGVISETSSGRTLTASGPGAVTLSGTTANTYTGLTEVAAGTLNLNKTAGVNAIGTGGLQIDAGATATLLASNQISDTASAGVNGTLALGTFSDTIGALNGTGSVTVGAGSTLTIGASNNLDSQFDGVISGAGTIAKTGTGTLALNGANTFGGAGQTVTLQNGNLQVSADNNLGNAANSLTFSGGTTLFWGGFNSARAVILTSSGTFNTNNNSATLSGVISGAGALTKAGAGTLTLSGTNSYSGGTQITGGNSSAVSVASQASLGSGAVTMSGGSVLMSTADLTLTNGIVLGATGGGNQGDGNLVSGMLNVATGTTLTLSAGVISETTSLTGRLEKLGGGTLYVNTANSYSGGTYLHDGTFVFANALALGPQPVNNPTQNALTIDNGAHLVLTLSGAFKRDVYIGNGGGGFGATSSSNVAFRNGVMSNVTAQSGGVTSESGINGFGGANTFSGNVTVNSGSAISVSRDVNLGAAANQLFLNDNSTLKVEDGVDIVANSSVQATFATSRQINLIGGQVTLEIDNTFNATNPLPSVLAAHTNILTLNGVVTGSGGLVKTGAGTLVLGNLANSYTGGTTINAGTLSTVDGSALSSAAYGLTINATAIFQATGTFTTVRMVTLGGTGGASSGATFDVTSSNNETRLGVVSGSGSLTKTGTGTLSLLGVNTYTGGSYINAGTVAINSSSSLGDLTGSATIGNATLEVVNDVNSSRNFTINDASSTVQVDAGATYSLAGTLSGAGVLNKTGDGVLALTGTNTYTGGTAINLGTIVVNSAASLGNGGPLTLNAGTLEVTTGYSTSRNITIGSVASTIQVDPAQTYTVTGVVSGPGSLTKNGTGNLTLTGANTFTGDTVVNYGTLTAAAASGSALASTATITVNDAGTLLLGASNQINNAAAITLNGGTLAKGNFSEGTAAAVGLGALTLANPGSNIDFGTGTVGVLSIASFNPGVDTLAIDNWTGTGNTLGTGATDRLIFNSDQSANLAFFSFTGYAAGATEFALANGFFEVTPITPVPETATYAVGILALLVLGYHQYHRLQSAIVLKQRRGTTKPE